ncbi:FHS family glucose/mannose:H+ symporter-like MFS transporter [Paenibacillus endophyticus]|uniref:FHS family glucose/mannose:H+ symporter-like MFS transporter n=1 Tax=Paenibacillus endophyticus TaxID=1294268 RepID=A0A7W5CE20_9BACL|nr:MFS transporter [Paenibacillus endophyticus]MBB3155988.1 FHS family glucose/mannose:H+ symporter-like MFS transporter [Paenibacillus endophyticus]
MKKLIWLGCLSYLIIGVAHVVGGSILEQLIAHYHLEYKDGGQWIMNQFLGFLVGVLLAPSITARVGKRGAVLIAMGVLTLSEAAYSLLLPWGWMLAIAPLAGLGFGMTEAVVGAMIIDMAKNGKASAMSRLETFFGVGALLIPIAAAYLIQQSIWQVSFPILAAMSGITFVLWLTMSFGEIDDQLGYIPQNKEESAAHADKQANRNARTAGASFFFGYPRKALPFLLLSALFFMIYVGMEMSFSNYLPSVLIVRSEVGESSAAAALSLFWGTMVLGRLFAGVLADRMGYSKYLLIATAGASVIFVLMAVMGELSWMLALVALSGLFFSGIFGIALVYANELIPGMTERTTSLLVACGGLGGAIFPRVTGWFMDQFDVQSTLWYITSLVVSMLLLLSVMLILGRKQMRAINAEG